MARARVTQEILGRRLAACVNIVPGVESHYWWQGQIEQSEEHLLIVKTRRELVDDLIQGVRAVHSYTVPEVVALTIVEGNPGYLEWVVAETTAPP